MIFSPVQNALLCPAKSAQIVFAAQRYKRALSKLRCTKQGISHVLHRRR
jgi:hypothetical protein